VSTGYLARNYRARGWKLGFLRRTVFVYGIQEFWSETIAASRMMSNRALSPKALQFRLASANKR
jgi:hypothetical protein